MVAERERVSRLTHKNQHAQRRPSLALPQRRRNERVRHQKMTLLMCLCVNGLLKPTDNVGQQAKDNWQDLKCQRSIKNEAAQR